MLTPNDSPLSSNPFPTPAFRLAFSTSTIAARSNLCWPTANVCINGVPTFAGFQMQIFEACLQAKRPYVDYGGMGVYTVRQKAEHDKWKQAGATAVIGLGSDPGLSNIICRAVADRLDRIDRINLYWAATKIGAENPVLVPPYSISTVLAEYANPSQQFLDGKLQEVPAQAGTETIDLPQPWGRTTFIHSQHSEPLTVPFSQRYRREGNSRIYLEAVSAVTRS